MIPRLRSIPQFDKRFAKYSGGTAGLVCFGPAACGPKGHWFGDQQRLIFSDIPNNRLMAYDISTGKTEVFPPAFPLHQR